jgi:hypothetical protein
MVPDIWRPLEAANQAKDRRSQKFGWKEPASVGLVYRPGGGIKDSPTTSVVELRQTRFSRVSISSNAQYVTLQTCFSHPSFSY